MSISRLETLQDGSSITLKFSGALNLHTIGAYEHLFHFFKVNNFNALYIDLDAVDSLDTAGALFIHRIEKALKKSKGIQSSLACKDQEIHDTLNLVKAYEMQGFASLKKRGVLESLGYKALLYWQGFIQFLSFFGELFLYKFRSLATLRNLRYKEIAFEINESAIKALGIIALTSFLVGVVIAYQSAYQLKIYGANIFIVDMLGLTILRELAPMITAIVLAGRSGSAFTAQIGAMKITEELDAMRTMGFDPYLFLVLPRIIALMIMMPVLIFVSDLSAIVGGMIIASIDLGITMDLFLDRFVGIIKGPFFAFLIASIAIYRGLMVKNDTQSIGFNTTKSVVESIFAVIVCDAVFSIAFTNLGL
jgi:phospholipid/cholesterol/gamma-HCH transport system permease protein